jgi:hypothetical protein
MLHYSSIEQNAVAPKAAILNTLTVEKSLTTSAPSKGQTATGKVSFSATKKSYKVARRYTIDDNGGSYEGL